MKTNKISLSYYGLVRSPKKLLHLEKITTRQKPITIEMNTSTTGGMIKIKPRILYVSMAVFVLTSLAATSHHLRV